MTPVVCHRAESIRLNAVTLAPMRRTCKVITCATHVVADRAGWREFAFESRTNVQASSACDGLARAFFRGLRNIRSLPR